MDNSRSLLLEIDMEKDKIVFPSSIKTALIDADAELDDLDDRFGDTAETIKALTPECDKLDYILAVCSGALCGIFDIFLVGEPGKTSAGAASDKWFANRTVAFAELYGYHGDKNSLHGAVSYLEKKFKVPYDQSVGGGIFKDLVNLTPSNHHFKSLAHNPTLLGLFFSILNQFTNTSDFVSEGAFIILNNSEGKFELEGKNTAAKLFCGFANWLGHLISDISGSSTSKGRGMGIPSPIWAWTNDVTVIKSKLKIPVSQFDKAFNEMALRLFEHGYDARFQAAQAIPVFLNETVVRLFYSVRRLLKYFSSVSEENRSMSSLWEYCKPFSNAEVKRMLTLAHGTFCLMDISDAVIRGFADVGMNFNISEFFMRLNIIGIGRFAISLFGEAKRSVQKHKAENEEVFIERERNIVNYYIDGLKILSDAYDDSELLTFVDDLKKSDMYIEAFNKSAKLAQMRKVPEEKILKSKNDIDSYFTGGTLE